MEEIIMNKDEIKEKLSKIFKIVFDNENLEIEDMTSSKDIMEWDSLSYIQFIISIQKYFDIKFNMQEIMKQENVGTLIDTIYEKIKK